MSLQNLRQLVRNDFVPIDSGAPRRESHIGLIAAARRMECFVRMNQAPYAPVLGRVRGFLGREKPVQTGCCHAGSKFQVGTNLRSGPRVACAASCCMTTECTWWDGEVLYFDPSKINPEKIFNKFMSILS